MNPGELAILPAPDAEQVAHDIALLLAIQLGHVLVRAHLGCDETSAIKRKTENVTTKLD